MEREDLERELRAHVSARPADAGALLRVIADALADYERAQEAKRGALADLALLTVLDPAWIAAHDVPHSIDAMLHQFPLGLGRGRAQREVECWEAFVRRCARGLDEDWLRRVKGEEYARWYDAHVRPSIKRSVAEGK